MFKADDGIRVAQECRGLGVVYKRWSQYLFVKTDGAGVVVCGAGETAVGDLFNNPAITQAGSVVRGGDPQVYAGTALFSYTHLTLPTNRGLDFLVLLYLL